MSTPIKVQHQSLLDMHMREVMLLRDRFMLEDDSQYSYSDLEEACDCGAQISVAYQRTNPVGYALWVFREPDLMILENIYVSKRSRGKGIAQALMTHEQAPPKQLLYVGVHNHPAIALYEKLKFRKVHLIPRYMGLATYADKDQAVATNTYSDAWLMANYDFKKVGLGSETVFIDH